MSVSIGGTTGITIPATATNQSGAVAWVNFSGITATIRASYNIASVVRNSAGDYTITFTNALADANYSVVGGISPNSAYPSAAGNGAVLIVNGITGSPYKSVPTSSSFRVTAISNPANLTTLTDPEYVYLAVFR